MTHARQLGEFLQRYAGEYRRAAARLFEPAREETSSRDAAVAQIVDSWRDHVAFGLEGIVLVGHFMLRHGWQAPLRERSVEALWPMARAVLAELGCNDAARLMAVDRGLRALAKATPPRGATAAQVRASDPGPWRFAEFHFSMTAASRALEEATVQLVDMARRSSACSLVV